MKETTNETAPYLISYKEVKWLTSVMGSYVTRTRPLLGFGFLVNLEDRLCLLTTDTHRIHLLRLSCDPGPVNPICVNLRRVELEMAFRKKLYREKTPDFGTSSYFRSNLCFAIEKDLSGAFLYSGGKPVPVAEPILTPPASPVPDFERVYKKPNREAPVSDVCGVDLKYLASACALASRNRIHLLGGEGGGSSYSYNSGRKS